MDNNRTQTKISTLPKAKLCNNTLTRINNQAKGI